MPVLHNFTLLVWEFFNDDAALVKYANDPLHKTIPKKWGLNAPTDKGQIKALCGDHCNEVNKQIRKEWGPGATPPLVIPPRPLPGPRPGPQWPSRP